MQDKQERHDALNAREARATERERNLAEPGELRDTTTSWLDRGASVLYVVREGSIIGALARIMATTMVSVAMTTVIATAATAVQIVRNMGGRM